MASQCAIGVLLLPVMYLAAQGHKVFNLAYDRERIAEAHRNMDLGGRGGRSSAKVRTEWRRRRRRIGWCRPLPTAPPPASHRQRKPKSLSTRAADKRSQSELSRMSARERLTYYAEKHGRSKGKSGGGLASMFDQA